MSVDSRTPEYDSPYQVALRAFFQAALAGDNAGVSRFLDQYPHRIAQGRPTTFPAVNEANEFGMTALILACFKGHVKTAALLLDRGAALECRDWSGHTPLLRAAREGHDDVVRLLISRGARADHRNASHETALDLAQQNGHKTTAVIIQQALAQLPPRKPPPFSL